MENSDQTPDFAPRGRISIDGECATTRPSLPSRGRGSKLVVLGQPRLEVGCRSLHGGVDRNTRICRFAKVTIGRSLHGGVDRNMISARMTPKASGRSLHGGVDRNSKALSSMSGDVQSLPSRGRGSKQPHRQAGTLDGESPPSRGRGSKPLSIIDRLAAWGRSLHGGVDRNFSPTLSNGSVITSLPSRGRGSKREHLHAHQAATESPPSRGRGSKQRRQDATCSAAGRPLHGGVDRNQPWATTSFGSCCRSLHGGVDRNYRRWPNPDYRQESPPSRGRGSKRQGYRGLDRAANVAPFTGAWIETLITVCNRRSTAVAPFTGAWIETANPPL